MGRRAARIARMGLLLAASGCVSNAPRPDAPDPGDCRTLYGDPPTPAAEPARPHWCGWEPGLWLFELTPMAPPVPPARGVCAVTFGEPEDEVTAHTLARWTFDEAGRPIDGVWRGGALDFEWREDGSVRVRREVPGRSSGTVWELDAADRVVRFVGPYPFMARDGRPELRLTYDEAGRLVEFVVEGRERRTFDPETGAPLRVERRDDRTGRWRLTRTVTPEPDGAFRHRHHPNGPESVVHCDVNGRPVPDGAAVDAAGRLVRRPYRSLDGEPFPEGTWAYDDAGRLVCEQRPYSFHLHDSTRTWHFPPGRPAPMPPLACAGQCRFSDTLHLESLATDRTLVARGHFRYVADGTLVAIDLDVNPDGAIDQTLDLAPLDAPDGSWRRVRRMGLHGVETETWWFDCAHLRP